MSLLGSSGLADLGCSGFRVLRPFALKGTQGFKVYLQPHFPTA